MARNSNNNNSNDKRLTDSQVKMNYLDGIVAEYRALQLQQNDRAAYGSSAVQYNTNKINAAENTLRRYAQDSDPEIAKEATKAMKILSIAPLQDKTKKKQSSSLSSEDQRFLDGAEKEYLELLDKKIRFIENQTHAQSTVEKLTVNIQTLQEKLDAIQIAGEKTHDPEDLIKVKQRNIQFQKTNEENSKTNAQDEVKRFAEAQKTIDQKLANLVKSVNRVGNKNTAAKTLAKKITQAFKELDEQFKSALKGKLQNEGRRTIPWMRGAQSTETASGGIKIGAARENKVEPATKKRRPAPVRKPK